MAYDFKTLIPGFEDLVRDRLGPQLGMTFDAFSAGPNQGIDGSIPSPGKRPSWKQSILRLTARLPLKVAVKKERT